jgi:hypothetical protein
MTEQNAAPTSAARVLVPSGIGFGIVGVALVAVDRNASFGLALAVLGGVLILCGALSHRLKHVKLPGGGEADFYPPAVGDTALAVFSKPSVIPKPGINTALHSRSVEFSDAEIVGALNASVAERALESLLSRPETGPLEGCELRLYTYDDSADDGKGWLTAIVEPADGRSDSREWPPGMGATGAAWEREEFVVAVGEQCWNSTYGVPLERSRDYRHLKSVAACPVFNASWDVLGVVSAECATSEEQLTTDEAKDEMLSISLEVGRVLVDLLKWFDDGDDVEDDGDEGDEVEERDEGDQSDQGDDG